MNHAFTEKFETAAPAFRLTSGTAAAPLRRSDDALDPIRGILIGTLLSVLVFWLPLALTLAG